MFFFFLNSSEIWKSHPQFNFKFSGLFFSFRFPSCIQDSSFNDLLIRTAYSTSYILPQTYYFLHIPLLLFLYASPHRLISSLINTPQKQRNTPVQCSSRKSATFRTSLTVHRLMDYPLSLYHIYIHFSFEIVECARQ